jgi:transposase-like protein
MADQKSKHHQHGGVKMTKCINGCYSKEFRSESVKLVVEGGESAYEVSRQLSLPKAGLWGVGIAGSIHIII